MYVDTANLLAKFNHAFFHSGEGGRNLENRHGMTVFESAVAAYVNSKG